MSCGCSAKSSIQDSIVTIRKGMCSVCPWLPPDAGEKQPCLLTIGGLPLQRVAELPGSKCKEHRWPDAHGIVDWGLRRWIGVPDPLRWVFLFRWGREPKPVGCGCDVGLKRSKAGRWLDPWMAISPELRGAVARIMAGWRATRAEMWNLH